MERVAPALHHRATGFDAVSLGNLHNHSETDLAGSFSLDSVITWSGLSAPLATALRAAFGATGIESPRLLATLPEVEYLDVVDSIRLGEVPAPLMPIQRAGARLMWKVGWIVVGVQETYEGRYSASTRWRRHHGEELCRLEHMERPRRTMEHQLAIQPNLLFIHPDKPLTSGFATAVDDQKFWIHDLDSSADPVAGWWRKADDFIGGDAHISGGNCDRLPHEVYCHEEPTHEKQSHHLCTNGAVTHNRSGIILCSGVNGRGQLGAS